MGVVTGGRGGATVRGPYSFGFAAATALAAGVAFYTPTVGDLLLDVWFEVDTSFNALAKADVSQYTGSGPPYGLFGYSAAPVNLQVQADTLDQGGGPLQGATHVFSLVEETASSAGVGRLAPARFTTADPLIVVVSQDGTRAGTATAATAGAARLYIITATPTAF